MPAANSIGRRPRYGILDLTFWLMMFTVNLQEILELWGIDTIYKPYRMISLGLAVAALPSVIRNWRTLRPFFLPLMIALGYAFIMTGVYAGSGGLTRVLPVVATSLVLLISPCVIQSRQSIYLGCYAYILGFVLSSVLGYYTESTTGRFSGLFHNPNYFGYAACICIIFLMSPALKFPYSARTLLVVGCFVIVFLSGSRASLVATVVAFATQIISNPKLFRILMALSLIAAISAIVSESGIKDLGKFNTVVVRRYTADEIERGGKGRIAVAQAALLVGREHWFVGIGIDQFRERHFYRFFQVINKQGELTQLGIHNAYVTALTEWGAVAFLLLFLMFFHMFKTAARVPEFRVWIRGFLISTLVVGLAGNVLGTPHFWLMFGFCAQLFRLSKKPEHRFVGSRQMVQVKRP
jgi:hypothetical protein